MPELRELTETEPADAPDRPSVTVKFAQTLDGRIATRTGHSQWISGQDSLTFAHELRASHDAIMVGVGTVLQDNPRLTVRLAPGRSPLRVVADSSARTPLESHVLAEDAGRTIIAAGEHAPADRLDAIRRQGARVLLIRIGADGRLDLADLLGQLRADGVRSIMVEGGPRIVTSLLRADLVDRLIVCIAPKLVGAGLEASGDLGIERLTDALNFSHTEVRTLGEDIIFDGRLAGALSCRAETTSARRR